MGPEFVEMSIEGHRCLADMVELPSDLERLSGQAWIIRRKRKHVLEKLPRTPYIAGFFVSSTTASALLQLGFIEQAKGEIFVVSKAGEEYYKHHPKPKT